MMASRGDQLHQLVASLIIGSLDGLEMSPEERMFFREFDFAGVTLFKRNVCGPLEQVRALCESVQSQRPVSGVFSNRIIAIDQEGGRVARIRDPRIIDHGPALRLHEEKIEEYYFTLSHQLKALGINCNFAPVVDVLSEQSNHSIGDRCFGRTAQEVVRRARLCLRGISRGGVLCALKHFPGQGDCSFDTHLGSGRVEASRATLFNREIKAFSDLLSKSPMVMISHAIISELDHRNPASLSKKIIHELLRTQLDYQGLVVSDDMLMAAVDAKSLDAWGENLCRAILAGTDLVLICNKLERSVFALEYITRRASENHELKDRIRESSIRVRKLRHCLFSAL